MPKDRLAEMKAKNGGNENTEEMDNLMPSNDSGKNKGSGQSFAKLSQQTKSIQDSLQQTHDKVTQMRSLHNTILSSPKSDPSVKEMLEKLTQTVTKEMNQIVKDLKATNKTATHDHKSRRLTDTEHRMIRTVHSSLTAKFQTVWEDLCSARSDYENRCRQRIQRQMEIAGYTMTDEETDEAMANGVPIFSRDFVESESAKLALRDLQERHQELLKLEKGIQEMHDMFLELNLMIESQGEVIDTIESCVVQAADKVEAGRGELAEAKVKQSVARRRKFKCIAISVPIAVILITIIVLVAIYT